MHLSQWVQNLKLAILFLIVTPLLSGCWDRLEIEERAVVLAIAVDEAPPSAEKEEKNINHLGGKVPMSEHRMKRLTVQMAIPGRIPLGPTQGGGGGGEKPVLVTSSIGHTLEDAFSNLQQELSDRIFLGHLRMIIVSEAVAREGLQNLNDSLRRNSEVRRAAWMVISKGKAADMLTMTPEMERVPALHLMQVMDGAVDWGKLPNAFVGIYWSALSSKGQEGYLPYIEKRKNNTILISGLAFFKRDKMVGTTTPMEIGHYMAIKGINPGGYATLTPVPGEPGAVFFLTDRRKSKMDVQIKNGKPHASIKIHIEGDLSERSNALFKIDENVLKKIEKEIETSAKVAFQNLVAKTQQKESDIFGFGEIVRGRHSAYWNEHIRNKDKWEKMYKEMSVDMDVSISIRRIGMKAY